MTRSYPGTTMPLPNRWNEFEWRTTAAFPSRSFKNRALPGQTGGRRTTVRNLEVLKVDAEQQLVWIKGSVPGARNSVLQLRKREA